MKKGKEVGTNLLASFPVFASLLPFFVLFDSFCVSLGFPSLSLSPSIWTYSVRVNSNHYHCQCKCILVVSALLSLLRRVSSLQRKKIYFHLSALYVIVIIGTNYGSEETELTKRLSFVDEELFGCRRSLFTPLFLVSLRRAYREQWQARNTFHWNQFNILTFQLAYY